MKKTVFAVSAALAFLFCACDRNSADCLDAIPGNSQAVIRINAAGLQKNGVDLSSAIDELNAAWNDEYDADIPYKGIDLQSDIYAFLSTEGRSNHFVGVTFALSDPKAFASSCSSAGRVKHDGDVDYIVDFDDVTIAWSGKAGIMLAGLDDQGSGRMADLAVSLLSGGQVPGGQFVATPSYGSLKSVKGPVAGIIDYSLYMDILDDNDVDFDEIVGEIGEYDRKLSRALKAWDYSDLAVVFGVDFDGEVMYAHTNFRGGHYTTGFWSMSNHVAFGSLTGALPSGRLAFQPFTPGLTPEANASKSLLDNIKDVSKLDPVSMNNNIAFNVKVNPAPKDTHEQTVNNVTSYAKAYSNLGGMQMQFNVVSSDTMRAAMANPDEYRDLMVRISGYNAYFVDLCRDLQLELVNRADYGM